MVSKERSCLARCDYKSHTAQLLFVVTYLAKSAEVIQVGSSGQRVGSILCICL